MEQTLPITCQVTFKDPHRLHDFILLIIPDEGYWIGGHFYFQIYISEEYNMAVILYFITFMYYVSLYIVCINHNAECSKRWKEKRKGAIYVNI